MANGLIDRTYCTMQMNKIHSFQRNTSTDSHSIAAKFARTCVHEAAKNVNKLLCLQMATVILIFVYLYRQDSMMVSLQHYIGTIVE